MLTHLTTAFVLAAAPAVAGAPPPAPAIAGTLTVRVTSVKAKGGVIRVALYARDPLYRDAAAIGEAKVTVAGEVAVSVPLRGVAAGDYVVSAFHDADSNGKFGFAAGKMTEGSAISNAEQLRGPPNFAVNKVAVPANGGKVSIRMSYPEDRQGW